MMMPALVAPLLDCVGGGTAFVGPGWDQAMDIMLMPARHGVTKFSFESSAIPQFSVILGGGGVSNRAKCPPRFQDLQISLRSHIDFTEISRDFEISISHYHTR